MNIDYSEDSLVEQPAIELFQELGWETANCFYEKFGENGTLGRETSSVVILLPRLHAALVQLNPDLPPQSIALAIEELTRDRSVMSPANANREVYRLLKNGVKVSFRGKENEETVENVRIIDWNEASNNDFFLASQFWVSGEMYKGRADLVCFVNGLPLVFIELKASHTVPLYYENRIPELQLTNKELNEDLQHLINEAELDPDQENKLEREFAREYHLITRDDRLEKIARDIVTHFMGRGQFGKAMVVSIDKATAVRMYDKVKKYWKTYMKDLQANLVKCKESGYKDLKEKIKFMEEIDMAVVVSPSQNEIEDFRKKGLDIAIHRRRMIKEDLDKKFKDPADPFRIVFVCAMWMTGFDVPSCSTIYLDKPMRNHTLMQAIARANRVFRDKLNGLIVDYVGVFRNLQKALAIYGSGSGGGIKEGETPVKDKSLLVQQLKNVISDTTEFCTERGIDISKIQTAYGFERVKLIDDAIDAILPNDESKAKYLSMAAAVVRIYRAILPDPAANEFYPMQALFAKLAEKIRSMVIEADISGVMDAVDELLDVSISTEGYVIRQPLEPSDLNIWWI